MDMENCVSGSASVGFRAGAGAAMLAFVPALHMAASMMGLAAGVFEAGCAAACCSRTADGLLTSNEICKIVYRLALNTHEEHHVMALAILSGSSGWPMHMVSSLSPVQSLRPAHAA